MGGMADKRSTGPADNPEQFLTDTPMMWTSEPWVESGGLDIGRKGQAGLLPGTQLISTPHAITSPSEHVSKQYLRYRKFTRPFPLQFPCKEMFSLVFPSFTYQASPFLLYRRGN